VLNLPHYMLDVLARFAGIALPSTCGGQDAVLPGQTGIAIAVTGNGSFGALVFLGTVRRA